MLRRIFFVVSSCWGRVRENLVWVLRGNYRRAEFDVVGLSMFFMSGGFFENRELCIDVVTDESGPTDLRPVC